METHGCLVHSGLWFLPSDVSVASTESSSPVSAGWGSASPGWWEWGCCSLRSASGSLRQVVQEEVVGPWQAAPGAELELPFMGFRSLP